MLVPYQAFSCFTWFLDDNHRTKLWNEVGLQIESVKHDVIWPIQRWGPGARFTKIYFKFYLKIIVTLFYKKLGIKIVVCLLRESGPRRLSPHNIEN